MEYKYLPYSRDFDWDEYLSSPTREEDIMKTCDILYKINFDSLPENRNQRLYAGLSYYNFRRLSEIADMAVQADKENREEDFKFLSTLYQKVYLYFDNSRGKYRPAMQWPENKKTKIKDVQLQKK